MGYVVSKGGTFGTAERSYRTETGVPMVVISWGLHGWLTPVPEDEVKPLRSSYEREAWREAKEWLELHEEPVQCVWCAAGLRGCT